MSEDIATLRAMLRGFRASGWRDLHVRAGGLELFLARPGGAPNPMAHQPDASEPEAAPERPAQAIAAPHLGAFHHRKAAGTRVCAGEEIGVIRALDRLTPVLAETDGVIEPLVDEGGFVEYGDTLAMIAA